MELSLSNIGQIALTVTNLETSIAFYRDILKMHFLFATSNLAFFDCSGVRLMLSLPENGQGFQKGSCIYFKVSGIEKAYKEMLARGLKFVDKPHLIAPMPDHDLWMVFFKDPDGNLFGIMSEEPKA